MPTNIEDREKAPKIGITAIQPIRDESLKLVQEIQDKMNSRELKNFNPLITRANILYKNYHSIYNLKIGGLLCENFVDFPKYFIENYILRHGVTAKTQKLPKTLFEIGYEHLLKNYYRDVTLCDNHVTEYKKKRP